MQADEHIITKLNLFFNYIINNNNSVENFENMKQDEKEAIVNLLKRLDLYIDNVNILELMPESEIKRYKIQYWLIHEIYYSPYKIFLVNLSRKQFFFRYYKALKYMNNCNLYEFISYFMRCVQEELEKSNEISDRKSNS